MSKQPFDEPRLAINRVYTRRGDQGETSLAGGQRVSKDGPRIEAYGTVDELNSFLGAARVTATEAGLSPLAAILLRVEHELFNLGSILATLPEDVHPQQARVTDAEVAQLESEMDRDEFESCRRWARSCSRAATGSTPSSTSAAPSAAAPSAPPWRWAAWRAFRRRPFAI